MSKEIELSVSTGYVLSETLTYALHMALDFADSLRRQMNLLSTDICVLNATTSELSRVLLCTFQTLLSKGFCMPEKKQDETEVDNNDDPLEGTGMGEGNTEGAEDVSNQIEDEEQLLGLESDQKQQELEGEQEDNGVEMAADFEGDLVDIEQKENEDEDEDEDDEEDKMDREMGEFDDEDENIVDERLWNSEDEEEEGKDNDNEENFDPKSIHGGESEEMRAKDEDEQEEDAQDDIEPQEGERKDDEKEEKEDENEGGAQDEEETQDASGVDLKDAKEENESYEIPEEMDIQDDGEEEEEEDGEGEKMDDEEDTKNENAEEEGEEEEEEVKDQVDTSAVRGIEVRECLIISLTVTLEYGEYHLYYSYINRSAVHSHVTTY